MASKSPAEQIIQLFGGIRPSAAKLEVPVTTVQGWKKRDFIPEHRYELILNKAAEHGLQEKISSLLSEQESQEEPSNEPAKTEETTTAYPSREPTQKSESEKREENYHAPGYEPRPLPQYTYKPERQRHWVASFAVSIVSATLALFILAILFFAPDILPFVKGDTETNTEQNQTIAYYQEQNQSLKDQISEYHAQVEDMTDRIRLLVKATQQMQNDISALRSSNQPAQLADMEKSLDAIRQSNNDLQKNIASLQNSESDSADKTTVAHIEKIVQAVNDRVEAMQQELDQTKTVQSSLTSNVDTLQGQDMAFASMILSANNINEAIGKGESFDSELNILKMLMGFDPEMLSAIKKLEPHAAKGIKGPEGMVEMLEMLSGDIMQAEYQGRDSSIRQKALRELNNMVSIRKAGELPKGDNPEKIIARAKIHLEEGNAEAALAELNSLNNQRAQNAARPLTEEIEAYLLAHRMIDQLGTMMAEYVPPEYMQGIVIPWLKTTKNAAQLKFPDPKDIKVNIPYKLPSDGGKNPYDNLMD